MKRDTICFISERIANRIIKTRRPLGRFICCKQRFTAIDNSAGEARTEDFANLNDAKSWLEGKET